MRAFVTCDAKTGQVYIHGSNVPCIQDNPITGQNVSWICLKFSLYSRQKKYEICLGMWRKVNVFTDVNFEYFLLCFWCTKWRNVEYIYPLQLLVSVRRAMLVSSPDDSPAVRAGAGIWALWLSSAAVRCTVLLLLSEGGRAGFRRKITLYSRQYTFLETLMDYPLID